MSASLLSGSRTCARSHCLLLTDARSWKSAISVRKHGVACKPFGQKRPQASQQEHESTEAALGSDGPQKQFARRQAAKRAFLIGWLGSVPVVFQVVRSAEVPPVLWQLLPGLAAASASVLLLLKALLQDRFQIEWHRGRLYFQLLAVPPTGPPVPEGSIEVRPTGDAKGNGAFAVQPLSKGQYVCYYEGELINMQEYFRRYPSGTSDHVMRVDDEYAVDASVFIPDTSRFSAVHMNHSRRPNVGRFYKRSEHRVEFYTLRDIRPGEELVYDYGKDYWSGREDVEL